MPRATLASPKKSSAKTVSPFSVMLIALGCPKNNVDAEHALAELVSDNFSLTDSPCAADLILINTCGFIQSARAETERTIARALKVKRQRQQCKVAIMGCYAQRYQREILRKFPQLDGILGLTAAGKIAARCREILGERQTIGDFADEKIKRIAAAEKPRLPSTPASYAYLRLSDGCDNRCSYCAIPLIRGKLRSRAPEKIIAEAEFLAANGYQELLLIAQDTTAYGDDFARHSSSKKNHFLALIERLLRTTTIPRLRILYAHPARLSVELLRLLGSEPRLCNYLDLPLQHINDRILTAMNRHYGREKVEKILMNIDRYCQTLTLRSSLIVGFPGETTAEFTELLNFVRSGKIANLGVFAYSPEPQTTAEKLSPLVNVKTISHRRSQIMRAQQKNVFARLQKRIGDRAEVLIDGQNSRGEIIARSDAEVPEIDGEIVITEPAKISLAAGDWATVQITGRRDYDLTAKIIDKKLPAKKRK